MRTGFADVKSSVFFPNARPHKRFYAIPLILSCKIKKCLNVGCFSNCISFLALINLNNGQWCVWRCCRCRRWLGGCRRRLCGCRRRLCSCRRRLSCCCRSFCFGRYCYSWNWRYSYTKSSSTPSAKPVIGRSNQCCKKGHDHQSTNKLCHPHSEINAEINANSIKTENNEIKTYIGDKR